VARRKKGRNVIYIVSIGFHVLLAAAIAFIPQKRFREVVGIALAETKHEEKPKAAPPPPPRAENRPARAAMAHAAAEAPTGAEEAAAKAATAFTDIGISLDSSSADGLAINLGPAAHPSSTIKAELAPSKPKLLVAKSNEAPCTEELVKAVPPPSRPSPKYTPEAENAGIEGKVRLELKVNERGEVETAKVLQGLGYGLDESAIQTVKRWQFRPATLCGKPVAASFIVTVVFSGS
jgi:protein TonB